MGCERNGTWTGQAYVLRLRVGWDGSGEPGKLARYVGPSVHSIVLPRWNVLLGSPEFTALLSSETQPQSVTRPERETSQSTLVCVEKARMRFDIDCTGIFAGLSRGIPELQPGTSCRGV